MIPREMAAIELAKVEAEIVKWEFRVARQRMHIRTYPLYGGIDLELSKQILEVLEAALRIAYVQRNRLLDRDE